MSNHECNVWCRPDEGIHVMVIYTNYPALHDVQQDIYPYMRAIRIDPAPEAPPQEVAVQRGLWVKSGDRQTQAHPWLRPYLLTYEDRRRRKAAS